MSAAATAAILDYTFQSIDRGIARAAAAAILNSAANDDDQHEKLSGMLRQCAAGLASHPEPAKLCRGNFHRLNEELRRDEPRFAPGMVATQVAAAADAFERAAWTLEGKPSQEAH